MRKNILLLVLGLCTTVSELKAQFPAAYASRLETVLDSMTNLFQIKGVSAAVTVPGLGTWTGVRGEAQAGVPLDASMALGIGSNTKTFIASLILKLEEQNQLSVEDTIGTWIQHPFVSGQITIRQLLNHTSGVNSFTNNPAFEDSLLTDFFRVWQPQEVLQFIGPADFAPGDSWNYSNSGYLLLGLIIEQVTGLPLETALRNEILTPAGLNNTWLYPAETPTATIPHVWSDNFSGIYMEDLMAQYNYSNIAMFSMAGAAGAMVSTAADNAEFWSKLITGQILTPASLAKMKQGPSLGGTTSYGLGIFRMFANSRRIYSHGGTNLGFINENLADTISGVGISVLTNQDSLLNDRIFQVVLALHRVTINPPTNSIGGIQSLPVFAAHPNPAQNIITIETEARDAQVKIVDLTGRTVMQTSIDAHGRVNISSLSPGSYLLLLHNKDGMLGRVNLIKP